MSDICGYCEDEERSYTEEEMVWSIGCALCGTNCWEKRKNNKKYKKVKKYKRFFYDVCMWNEKFERYETDVCCRRVTDAIAIAKLLNDIHDMKLRALKYPLKPKKSIDSH